MMLDASLGAGLRLMRCNMTHAGPSNVSHRSSATDCPSARPDMTRARVFGLIGGSPAAPRVAYLSKHAVAAAFVLKDLGGIDPGKIYRFAAACAEHRCTHYDGAHCSLAERIVTTFLPVVETLPACEIRSACRWHAEQGDAICLRCPEVVTMVPRGWDAPVSSSAADPAVVTSAR